MSVAKALDLLINKGIGCLPVVQDGQLLGIVTKTNLLQRLRMLRATESEREYSPDQT